MTARLTPDEDIEHEDDEADDSTAGAILSGGVHGLEGLVGDGRSVAQGCQAELEEEVEHGGGWWLGRFGVWVVSVRLY